MCISSIAPSWKRELVCEIGGEVPKQSQLQNGVPGETRTLDPLLRSYTTGLSPINLEAKLLFCAYLYFSYKT